MKLVSLFVVLAVVIGLFADARRKLLQWLGPLFPRIGPLPYGIAYGLAVTEILGAFIVSRVPGNGIFAPVFYVCHYLLEFIVYTIMSVNLVGLFLFPAGLLRLLPTPLSCRVNVTAGTIPLLLSATLFVYRVVYGAVIQIRPYEIQTGGQTQERAPPRIALISDLHLGYVIGEYHPEEVINTVNPTKLDLVCIAGDILGDDTMALANVGTLKELFLKIELTYSVYTCLENHDISSSYDRMMEFLLEAGIQVLQDEAIVIDDRFVLAGRKGLFPINGQGERRESLELPERTEDLPVIVMDHQPGDIRDYGEETDLILCGYTHKGQMLSFSLVTDTAFGVDYGYYRVSVDPPQVIVVSGTETQEPSQRAATDSEMAEILVMFPVRR